MFNIYKKIFNLNEKKNIYFYFIFIFISTILETFSVGLVVPVIYSLIDFSIFDNFLFLKKLFIDYSLLKVFFSQDTFSDKHHFISTGLFLMICFFFLKSIFLTYANFFQIRFINNLNLRWSSDLYKGYLNQSYNFHVTNNSALLIRNIYEAQTCSSTIQSLLIVLLDSLVLTGIMILILSIYPATSMLLLLFLISISSLFYFFSRNYVYKLGKERHYRDGVVQRFMQEGLGGFKLLKIMNKINFFSDNFLLNKLISVNTTIKNENLKVLPKIYLELLIVIIICNIILFAIYKNYEINSIVGLIALYGAATFKLIPSLNRIISNLQKIKYDYPAFTNLYKQLALINKNQKQYLNEKKYDFNRIIEFKNIYFSYSSDATILENVNFEIKKGNLIGIVGESGAGKSTVLNLIVGLIDKSDGKIYVDNQEISEKLKLTNKIGYVPQETFLIDDTIENNICLGLSEQSDKLKINQIIKETQLEDLIKNLPLGLQTHIGEKGLRISGGQRQRLGIARALYTNPSILVFDEATSSLDSETENEILDVIKELKKEKTIIVVTHKSNISDLCDHLYRLQNKKIIKVK